MDKFKQLCFFCAAFFWTGTLLAATDVTMKVVNNIQGASDTVFVREIIPAMSMSIRTAGGFMTTALCGSSANFNITDNKVSLSIKGIVLDKTSSGAVECMYSFIMKKTALSGDGFSATVPYPPSSLDSIIFYDDISNANCAQCTITFTGQFQQNNGAVDNLHISLSSSS